MKYWSACYETCRKAAEAVNVDNVLMDYLGVLRPRHWLKSLLILFPPFFAGTIAEPSVIKSIPLVLIAFSFVASSGYIINDVRDAEFDSRHHVKRKRMISNGLISVPTAILIAVALFATSLLISLVLSKSFWIYLIGYLLVSLSYTFILKKIVIIDVIVIATGFLIRVLAGGDAFQIVVTDWLFLTVFMVALLLAAGKRLGELILLGDEAHKHRKSLNDYSHSFLEGTLWFSASAALVMYALYTLEHKNGLFYTVPVAAFGLLRYIYIVHDGKGDPTEALLKDKQILGTGVLWMAMISMIIY